MKKRMKIFAHLGIMVTTAVLFLGQISVAHACRWFFYQPAVPAGLKKKTDD